MKIQLILIIISAVLTACGNAPVEAWYLSWFAIAPFWIIIILPNYQATEKFLIKKSKFNFLVNQNFLFSLLWGFIFYGFSLFWITGIHPLTWMGIPCDIKFIYYYIFVGYLLLYGQQPIVIIWSWILKKINNIKKSKYSQEKQILLDSIRRIIIGVTCWCGLEIIWSYTPLWWPTLALTQSPHNLIILQLGKLSSTTAITAAILVINGIIAEAYIHFYLYKKQQLLNSKKISSYFLDYLDYFNYFIPFNWFIYLSNT